MSDRVIPEELHNSLQGFLRAVFLHPEVGGELHQAAGSLFDALSALAPASSERAAAGDERAALIEEHERLRMKRHGVRSDTEGDLMYWIEALVRSLDRQTQAHAEVVSCRDAVQLLKSRLPAPAVAE